MSLWCNWVAWSPVLAIGSGLAAGYLLSVFFAAGRQHQHLAGHAGRTWASSRTASTLRINAMFIIGALILLAVWNIQHYGILRTARDPDDPHDRGR